MPHSALKGGEAERLFRQFLNDHLPKRFAAGAGFILDPRDAISNQTDCVIYDAFNCPVYRASQDAAIFPSNNVAAVVEVKSVLTKALLLDGLDKNAKVKSLAKVLSPEIGALVMDQTLACIFAFESAITLDKIVEHYHEWLRENPLGRHTDYIAVLDRGMIAMVAQLAGADTWGVIVLEGLGGPAAEGAHLGIGQYNLGNSTLDAFFRYLLAQLTFFRRIVDHPGFGLTEFLPEGKTKVMYLTSITNEKDPDKRKQILKQYAEAARADFAKSPVPSNWPSG